MYQKGGKEHFDFSGSIELEPAHQEEIDRFQAISFRYVLELVLYGGLLWIVHYCGLAKLFSVLWGGLVLLQLAIHLDHFHYLTLFRYASRSIGIQGHIQFARWLVLRLSSIRFFGFSLYVLNGVFILWQPGYSRRSYFLSSDSYEASIAIEG
jgi:hypothetical protein